MKSVRKLLSLVLALAVVATFALPVFGEPMTDADVVKTLGLLQGGNEGVTPEYLAGTSTRLQAAIVALRLAGKEADALAWTGAATFTDADDVTWQGGKNILAYLKANPDLGWIGYPDGSFKPNDPASAQMFYKVMLVALGYGYGAGLDFDWTGTIAFADGKGLNDAAAADPFINADIAKVLVETLKTNVKAGDKTLAQKLVDDGVITSENAIATGLIPEPALAVTSVTALNNKQVSVVFNRAVDKTSVETEANFTIATVASGDATLQADGKTVILTLADETVLGNAGTSAIKVLKAVKDASGTAMAADYSITISIVDTTVPSYVSTKATGAKTLVLTFSEPVYDANGGTTAIDTAEITVKSGIYTYIVTSAVADYAKRTITITTGTDLLEGLLTIKINAPGMGGNAIRDFAGLIMIPLQFDFAYAKDTSVAVVTLASVVKETKKATVTFSKPVTGTNVTLYHSVSGVAAYGTADVTKTASDSWEFTFTNALPSGTLPFYLISDDVAADQITDLFGVKVPNQVFTFTVIADTVPPTVTNITVNANTYFEVTFSEAVDATEAGKTANYSILKPDGTALAITSITIVDTTKVKLNAALTDNTTYTVVVNAMKDAALVAMAAPYSKSLAVGDNTAPTVTGDYRVNTKDVFIKFSEPMNATEVVNKANYLVDLNSDGVFAALADADTIVAVANNKIKITIDAGGVVDTSDFRIAGVHDLAGKLLTPDTVSVFHTTVVDTIADALTLDSVNAFAKNKIRLTFSNALGSFDIIEFAVKTVGHAAPATDYGFISIESNLVNGDGKQEVVLVLANDLTATAVDKTSGAALEIETVAVPANTKSLEGTILGYGEPNFADKIAPSVKYFDYQSATKIIVAFDENLDPTYIAPAGKNGFSVNGGTLTTALKSAVYDNVIVLTGTDFTADTDVIYTAGNLVDASAAKNALASVARTDALTTATLAASAASPVNATATITMANFVPTFTAIGATDVKGATATAGDFTLTGTITGTAGDDVLTVAVSAGGVVTVAYDDGVDNLNTVTAASILITNTTTGAVDTVLVTIDAGTDAVAVSNN